MHTWTAKLLIASICFFHWAQFLGSILPSYYILFLSSLLFCYAGYHHFYLHSGICIPFPGLTLVFLCSLLLLCFQFTFLESVVSTFLKAKFHADIITELFHYFQFSKFFLGDILVSPFCTMYVCIDSSALMLLI